MGSEKKFLKWKTAFEFQCAIENNEFLIVTWKLTWLIEGYIIWLCILLLIERRLFHKKENTLQNREAIIGKENKK